MATFQCKVTTPGPYSESIIRAREANAEVSEAGKRAVTYLKHLPKPELPIPPSDFKKMPEKEQKLWTDKMVDWMGGTLRYFMVQAALTVAKDKLAKSGSEGEVMQDVLKTEGVAELLSLAAVFPMSATDMDYNLTALASAAWYLRVNATCVNRRAVFQGKSEEFLKNADFFFNDTMKRANAAERDLPNCNSGRLTPFADFALATLEWARKNARPYCGGGYVPPDMKHDDPMRQPPTVECRPWDSECIQKRGMN